MIAGYCGRGRLLSSSLYLVEVLGSVLVGHVGGTDVKLEVRTEILKVVVIGQLWEGEGRGGEGRGERMSLVWE